jgi:hypothetical protein
VTTSHGLCYLRCTELMLQVWMNVKISRNLEISEVLCAMGPPSLILTVLKVVLSSVFAIQIRIPGLIAFHISI